MDSFELAVDRDTLVLMIRSILDLDDYSIYTLADIPVGTPRTVFTRTTGDPVATARWLASEERPFTERQGSDDAGPGAQTGNCPDGVNLHYIAAVRHSDWRPPHERPKAWWRIHDVPDGVPTPDDQATARAYLVRQMTASQLAADGPRSSARVEVTDAHRAAWSARLRELVAASAERDRCRVVVDYDEW